MSTAASSTLDSQLFTTWGLNSYSDVSMVVPGGYSSRLWTNDCQPQFWSKYQVWEWLQQMMDMYQIDASSMPMHNFDIDGCQLCSMSYQDFLRAAGSAGAILYHSLTDLKLGPCHVDTVQLEAKPTEFEFSYPFPEAGYPSMSVIPRLHPCHPLALPHPLAPVLKLNFPHNSFISLDPRGSHLWEFIRDILLYPERNPGLIKWEDRTEGVFRFLKSEAVAQLWGRRKNNSSMTYEKLSRAMRYYYKREILERVDGRRLVYKFGRNARGWKELETAVLALEKGLALLTIILL
ncbi:ETS-like factor [Merluccius polli]|uniref:ETS homologous factor n=1 Tax=Merluccius polli TaxID=89951 RepID=A0AA47MFM7_MERPO|nr:ETS-like factor [Merluccius polli]